MKRYFPSLICVLVLLGCATSRPLSGQVAPKAREISLADIKQFEFAKDTTTRLEGTLGKPEKVVPIAVDQSLWVYQDQEGQRASFVIDPASGVVQTGALFLKDTDPLHDLRAALTYFKGAKFSIQDEGWIAGHHLSSEADYIDLSSGVSLRVNKDMQTVSMIGFGAPKIAPRGFASGN